MDLKKVLKGLLASLLVLLLILNLIVIVATITVKFQFLNYDFYEKNFGTEFYQGVSKVISGNNQGVPSGVDAETLKQAFSPVIKHSLRTIKTGEKFNSTETSNIISKELSKKLAQDNQQQVSSGLVKQLDLIANKMAGYHKYYLWLNTVFYSSIALLFILFASLMLLLGANGFLKKIGYSLTVSGIAMVVGLIMSKELVPEFVASLSSGVDLAFISNLLGKSLIFPQIVAGIFAGLGIVFLIFSFFVKDDVEVNNDSEENDSEKN